MFKFNFAAESEGEHKEETELKAEPLMTAEEVPAEEVGWNATHGAYIRACQACQHATASKLEPAASQARYLGLQDVVKVAEGVTLLKGQVSNAQAASLLGQQQVADSDLLPGQYEGGFKVSHNCLQYGLSCKLTVPYVEKGCHSRAT